MSAPHQAVHDRRNPILTQQLPIDLLRGQPPYSVEYSYINCTGRTVVVSERNGLKVALRSENDQVLAGFTIKVVYKFSQQIAQNLINQLRNSDIAEDDPLHPVKVGLIDRPCRSGTHYLVAVDYHLKRSEFGSWGGSVYLSDADALLTMTDDITSAPLHPYSEEHNRYLHGAETNTNAFVYKLEIVDNGQSVTKRFANIHGEVFAILPIKDPSRQDGLYRYSRRSYQSGGHDKTSYETYFALADMAKAGVYASIDEAMYSGDLTLQKKEAVLRAEHEALVGKFDAARNKHDNELAAAAMQLEKDQRKHAQEIEMIGIKHQENLRTFEEERKRMELKDHYESRGFQRKDDSEFMKHLPVIILGVGTAIAAFMGIMG